MSLDIFDFKDVKCGNVLTHVDGEVYNLARITATIPERFRCLVGDEQMSFCRTTGQSINGHGRGFLINIEFVPDDAAFQLAVRLLLSGHAELAKIKNAPTFVTPASK